MAQKEETVLLFRALVRAPWWLSVFLAVMVYVGVGVVLPSSVDYGPYRPLIDALAGPVAWLVAGLFLLLSAFSALRSRRDRRMLAANRVKEAIRELGWDEFEELIAAHYHGLGFRVSRTGGAGPDGGVDVRITKAGGETYLVQCKHWRAAPVGVKVVRELLGVVTAERATGGIVVTTGSFTPEAERFADGQAVELVDGDRLEDTMRHLPAARDPARKTTRTRRRDLLVGAAFVAAGVMVAWLLL